MAVLGFRTTRSVTGSTLAEQRTRTLNERFATAADKLGGDKPAAVRLAGVYAMAGLADDWPENRQTCVDVLCAYLRLPYDPDPGDAAAPAERAAYRANREVRHTIIRLIGAHLRAGAGASSRPAALVSWQDLNFDFTGVVFDGGDFFNVTFSGRIVNFRDADFSGGEVDFSHATFSGGAVSFVSAKYSSGTVIFENARFSSSWISFYGAEFSGARVNFAGAEFSGEFITLQSAKFSSGTVDFRLAEFSGGTVNFGGATFSGGTVDFGVAAFSGGTVNFGAAEFSGSEVDFSGATFSGGEVDFSDAVDWSHPPTFDWDSPPQGVTLPPDAGIASSQYGDRPSKPERGNGPGE